MKTMTKSSVANFLLKQTKEAEGRIKAEEVVFFKDTLIKVFKNENIKVVQCFRPSMVKFVQVTTYAPITSLEIQKLELHIRAHKKKARYGFRRSGAGITIFFY